MTKTPTMRIDRLLANMGYGSRRDIERMANGDRIVIDGKPVDDVSTRIAVTPDLPARMSIDRERIDPPPGLIIALHKPPGVTCSHKEAGALVYDLLPLRWRRRDPAISTVGRLDKNTSGLLLMTDDGALLHRIIAPKSHVAKRYRVDLARPLKGDETQVFGAGGLMLESDDKPLLPADFEPLTERSGLLRLHEGRYHQVRRMFAAIGNHVDALHRDRIGALTLPDDLAAGQWRLLEATDIARIFA
ncbi:MAG: 16S rRNA pseudouridine(516) synthase [Alphaproteobacteria bacterium]|nr:16S rRNA pseudouridine(516) synthase [Alphaproteobacteria bacterium]